MELGSERLVGTDVPQLAVGRMLLELKEGGALGTLGWES